MRPSDLPSATWHAAWHEVLPGVLRFQDSCNVYAVIGPDGVLVVDAGTGAWLDAVDVLPGEVTAVACTHYFRDHAAGAARAAERGIPVLVPAGERELFAEPDLHFLRRESYVIYTNTWDHFAPVEAIPVAGVLEDHASLSLAGLDVEVVPLAGATPTQIGLDVTLPDGTHVVLCGETIHSPGRVPRIAPLEYGYGDLPGAVGVIIAARDLRRRRPAALLPSLGEPVVDDVDGALVELERNLRAHRRARPFEDDRWNLLDRDPLDRVSPSVWRTASSNCVATFVVAPSGRVLAVDLGYDPIAAPQGDSSPAPHRRRGSLRAVRELGERLGREGVDLVLPSHFHDDHVASIPLLQRVHGTPCWAPEWFAEILERPADYAFPCLWPVPIAVERRLRADEPVAWEGLELRCHPLSGHTRFATAITWEIDGLRYLHTGDQYHSSAGWLAGFPAPADHTYDWTTDEIAMGHVYRNGAFLRSYADSARLVRDWRPDVVLTGHQPAIRTDAAFFDRVDEHARLYEDLHRRAVALGDDEVHFELDGWGGWIAPYRNHLPAPGTLRVSATVRNPLPTEAQLDATLVGGPGWRGSSATVRAAARTEVRVELTLEVPTPCRRRPFAVDLRADGRPFGQVAEALVTVGGPTF
ncbi:MAG: hypothetical protein AVDCRST_MAG79-2485 [uncultured Thermoleophilia bacterium]|uniref:Metallo-beta-lactamase domain-containing protein n=1 Tax=uncultured Thermoleophilia bacterium TaxID=1497501 RepID=A0A6J4UED8_9ACTN|nr:MAG: hypothetical protein AVDCRST_MAG79-2485 [uncultured Thermoleophilia bacterium]